MVGGGGLEQFSVSPRPGFGFGLNGLGLRVWGQGLTVDNFLIFDLGQ